MPDRVRALISSSSVLYDRSDKWDAVSGKTPKQARLEEYWQKLSLYWLSILTDKQSAVFSETGGYHRIIGRYIIAALLWLRAVMQACMIRYNPNMDYQSTFKYLQAVVNEELQGFGFDRNNAHHMYLLSLVPEERLAQMDGYFVLMPHDDIIAAANKSISDRYLRVAGLLPGTTLEKPSYDSPDRNCKKEWKDLTKRPYGACIICWKPKSECKGYGKQQGYFCKNGFHPNNKHNKCGFKHVWEELGGFRCTPCGSDEPWPLPAEMLKSMDKPDADK
jgi:hypothetical protein